MLTLETEKLQSIAKEISSDTLSQIVQSEIDERQSIDNAGTDCKFNINFYRVGELTKNIKPADWLIEGSLEANTMALMFAPPASFKSFVAVDIAACIATGKQWHGHDVKQGAVFYIAGEGKEGLKRRFRAWEIANEVDTLPYPLFQSSEAADILNISSVTKLTRLITEISKESGTKPKLIIIDTLARNFGGGNENDTRDMNMFIRHIDAIRAAWECTVLVVHHTGHASSDRGRGSSALKAALDSEYQIKRDGDSNLVTVNCTKMKDAEPPKPLNLELKGVELGVQDEKGYPVTSAVLVDTDLEPVQADKKQWKPSGPQEAILQAIRSRQALKEPTTRAVIRDDFKAQGTSTGNFSRDLNKLIEKGLVGGNDNGYHLIVATI